MKKILIVDDDYLDIMSIERALARLDVQYSLHVAHNGVEALELLNGNNAEQKKIVPDIILLDINMPKMSGPEFLRIIKNYITFSGIKIFITTTSSEEHDQLSVQQLGIDGYILKPLEFDKAEKDKSGAIEKLKALLLSSAEAH